MLRTVILLAISNVFMTLVVGFLLIAAGAAFVFAPWVKHPP